MQRSVLRVGLLLALLGAPTVAFADARTEARRHFRHGMELIVGGDVDGGVAELQAAYDILPHPNVLYNIGRAYAEVGRYEEARDYFEQYLESDPPDREEVRAIVAAIDVRIAARGETTEPVAETSDATPDEGGAAAVSSAVASEEDVAQLRATAAQLRSIAELSGSDALLERVAELERLAAQLDAARIARAEELAAREAIEPVESELPVDTGTPPVDETAPPAETGALIDAGEGERTEGTYDEEVVSSSRYAQSPLDAASATTIITRQDIRLTGITNFPELLRRVAGVHLMAMSPNDVNIAIRGFNRTIAPRVVVLLNGRSTYIDALGVNFFSSMAVDVEDVERIEIIRGPASALYGANAFSGIINIITRAPGDQPGTDVTLGGGNGRTIRAHLGTTGRRGDFTYRVGAGFDQADRWSLPFDPEERVDLAYPVSDPAIGMQIAHTRVDLRYRVSEDVRVAFEGGFAQTGQLALYGNAGFTDTYSRGPSSYVMGSLETGWVTLRTFWNRYDFTVTQADQHLPEMNMLGNTVDVEGVFAREFELGVPHNLHLGVGYRWKSIAWDILDRDHTQNHASLFFEDTLRISEVVRLTAGFRMDRHPLLANLVWSPRAALVLRPSETRSLRISGTSSFRTMSFAESYVQFSLPTPAAAGVGGVGVGSQVALDYPSIGASRLRPERIITAELGYLDQTSDYFSVEVSLYYNRVYDIMGIGSDQGLLRLADYADPTFSGLAGFDTAQNRFAAAFSLLSNPPDKYNVYGGELALRAYPATGLDLYANYSINYVFVTDAELGNDRDRRQPNHMVNAGLQYRAPFGLDLAVDVHYYGSTVWPEVVFSTAGLDLEQMPLPAYYLLNGRIGFRPPGLGDRLEFAVVGSNITNNRIKQHPLAQTMSARVLGTITARF